MIISISRLSRPVRKKYALLGFDRVMHLYYSGLCAGCIAILHVRRKIDMDRLPEGIIDFHVHLFPDRLFDSIWDYFSNVYKWDVKYQFYYRECVDYLEKHHVSPIVYSNYAHKRGIAEELNEWNLRVLDEIPGLYCFAAFHPDDDNAIKIAEKVLSHPKVLGFKLQLLVQRFYPQDKRLFPLYEMVMDKGKRILFHVGTGPVGNEFVGIENFRKLLDRYPELPANVAHLGGYEYKEFMDLLKDHPNLYLDTAFTFLPISPVMSSISTKDLEDSRHRIVYGSDFPNLIFPREEELEFLSGLGLSDEFYSKVFWENGMRLIETHSG